MGRLAVLPSEVKSFYLMLQQAFKTGLDAGLALIHFDSQDGFNWIWSTRHYLPTTDVDDVLIYSESEYAFVN